MLMENLIMKLGNGGVKHYIPKDALKARNRSNECGVLKAFLKEDPSNVINKGVRDLYIPKDALKTRNVVKECVENMEQLREKVSANLIKKAFSFLKKSIR